MKHSLWFLPAVALVCGPLSASELLPIDGAAPFRRGWQKCDVTKKSPVRLRKQPTYGSRSPWYIGLRLGSGSTPVIVAAIDDSNGGETNYDRLYLDANNNLDLTDDAPIAIASNATDRTVAFDSGPVEVLIRYSDGEPRSMRIRLEMRGLPAGPSPGGISWTVMCAVDQHLEGRIDVGGRTNLLVGIFDSSRGKAMPNGCFNDYEVDRFRVDMDGDGRLDEKTEDYPLSQAVPLDGRLWDFTVDSAGRDMKFTPSALRTGRLNVRHVPSAGASGALGEAELVSGRGLAFAMVVGGDRATDMPEGSYSIASARMAATDSTGGAWKAVFSVAEPFRVKRGRTAEVTIGAPLKVAISIHKGALRPGNDVCIAAEITGAGGEIYEDISITGARMAPLVKVVDANDIVVAVGKMEYG